MTTQEQQAFGQRMTGGYEAPILVEPRGGAMPKPETSRPTSSGKRR